MSDDLPKKLGAFESSTPLKINAVPEQESNLKRKLDNENHFSSTLLKKQMVSDISDTVGFTDPITGPEYEVLRSQLDPLTKADAAYCFRSLLRFHAELYPSLPVETALVETNREERLVQMGLNFGRLQQIVDPRGGKEKWWVLFRPLFLDKNKQKEFAQFIASRLNGFEISLS